MTVHVMNTPMRVALAGILGAALTLSACSTTPGRSPRAFASPEEAVRALNDAVKKEDVAAVLAIFGPQGKELLDSSDPVSARRNRAVFAVAFAEGWRLLDEQGRKWLVIGHEAWPFPVPIVQEANGWQFDTAAGKEEVLARRIGRNELTAIRVARAYVVAQRRYAGDGHDGRRPGLYAQRLRSDPGQHNGLYWPTAHGERRSPVGDLLSEAAFERDAIAVSGAAEPYRGYDFKIFPNQSKAAAERPAGASPGEPAPFHGYYFRILTAQGEAAAGGTMDYIVGGEMSRGFALVAWPAQYDVTGVMTFVVSHEGTVYQGDLGPDTDARARAMTRYDPDGSWAAAD
jgi:hypothetical protein